MVMGRRYFFKGIAATAASLALEPIPAELVPVLPNVLYFFHSKYPLQYIRFTYTVVY